MAALVPEIRIKWRFRKSRIYGLRMRLAAQLIVLACRIASGVAGHIEIEAE